jgi:hypothetical protein
MTLIDRLLLLIPELILVPRHPERESLRLHVFPVFLISTIVFQVDGEVEV